jgi:hypothetical protein
VFPWCKAVPLGFERKHQNNAQHFVSIERRNASIYSILIPWKNRVIRSTLRTITDVASDTLGMMAAIVESLIAVSLRHQKDFVE